MNNPAFLRTLIIFSLIVPLAVFVGYMLTTTSQWGYSTFAMMGVFVLALAFPIFMRWHYPLMLLSWNMAMVLFFIKGAPNICLLMVVISLGVSILERAVGRTRGFISVPQLTLPLVFLIFIEGITAKLTGGIGLRAFGSDVYGGKKYLLLLLAILGYFALSAQRIPPKRARLYVVLFFIGGLTYFIGDLFTLIPSSFNFIFWFFPPTTHYFLGGNGFDLGQTRMSGTAEAAFTALCCLLTIYGMRGVFLANKPWRLVLFLFFFGASLLGGFRSTLISIVLILFFLFFLEGLHRTKLLPIFVLGGLLCTVLVIPLAPSLPFTFQRALAFLPLQLSPDAKLSAEESTDWRIRMWDALLPEIPKHLLLGKGYAISLDAYEMMEPNSDFHAIDPSQQGLALAGDYHNGPLSVILPFGIWGVFAVLWFFIAASRVMYCNYRYGDPQLKTLNTLLLAMFWMRLVMFLLVIGELDLDMLSFAGYLGLSVAINGGMCRPGGEFAEQTELENTHASKPVLPFRRPSLQPAFPRRDLWSK
jgi:O-Antigen ligase